MESQETESGTSQNSVAGCPPENNPSVTVLSAYRKVCFILLLLNLNLSLPVLVHCCITRTYECQLTPSPQWLQLEMPKGYTFNRYLNSIFHSLTSALQLSCELPFQALS